MLKTSALLGMATLTLGIAAPATAATYYSVAAHVAEGQTGFQYGNVNGQRETQTTISLTNDASTVRDLGITWVSRILNGINAPWVQADLSFETSDLYARPQSGFYTYDPADTNVVPPASSGYTIGDSLDFFDFGSFAPGETRQKTLIFLVSPSLGAITGSVRVVEAAAVPEPASWALLIGGFGLVGSELRRRRTRISFA